MAGEYASFTKEFKLVSVILLDQKNMLIKATALQAM